MKKVLRKHAAKIPAEDEDEDEEPEECEATKRMNMLNVARSSRKKTNGLSISELHCDPGLKLLFSL